MENPLADIYRADQDYKNRERELMANRVMQQTGLTIVQLHERKTLKNKKKLAIAIKEIREFADMLETLEY